MDIGLVEDNLFWRQGKWKNLGENLYIIALVIYIISQFLPGTMFPSLLPNLLPYRMTQFAGGLVILKMAVFDFKLSDGSWKNWIIYISLGLILWRACADAYQYNLYYYYLFIIGAQKIDYRKLLKVFLSTMVVLVILTVLAAKLRIIPGLTMGRSGTPTVRYALGMIYPSDLAARAFYLMLAYCVLKKFRLNLPEYIACVAWTVLIYIMTDTKLDAILMVLVVLASIFYRQIKQMIQFIGAKLLILGTLFVTGISVLLAYFYVPNNPILSLVNRALSDRLKYENMVFEKYNVTIFGQYIRQRGNGGVHKPNFDYFFIDSSYIRHLMMNGMAAFMVIMIVVCVMIAIFVKTKSYSLLIYLMFVILSSIIDQHMLEISFNFAFVALLSNTTSFEDLEKRTIKYETS